MDASLAVYWWREALTLALVLAAPLLGAALLVGVVAGAVQAMTQLHDPVVALAPRLLVTGAVALLVAPWLVGAWLDYAVSFIQTLPEQIF
jgi:flagellar biosynthetic protein FliQ